MYRAGLQGSELREFHQALRSHHSLRVRIYVLSIDGEHMADLSQVFEDGQVDIDADAEITRSATVSFADKGRTMDFDSDSPNDGALFANRMLRIEYRVKVDALNEWVEIPVFTGPVTKLDRSGDSVNVEAQSKEILAMGAAWNPMDVKKGVPKVDAIRRIMRERGGEDKFDLPDLHARLPKTVPLGRESSPWAVCQGIAASMDKQLFYDGAGRLQLRQPPGNTVFTFSGGDGGELRSEPQVAFSTDNVANIVWVKGGKPKATRRKNETRAEFETRQEKLRGIRYYETAPRSHPLSPWRLGRTNAPRFLLEVVENDKIRSEAEARKVAGRILNHRLDEAVDVTFDSLVIPHLEPGDKVSVQTDIFSMAFRLRQFSIPLRHDGTQSIGFLKRANLPVRRPNRRNTNKNKPRRRR